MVKGLTLYRSIEAVMTGLYAQRPVTCLPWSLVTVIESLPCCGSGGEEHGGADG